ncbi:MAG: membrane protein insertase YidC, partial [Bacteroidetes bacterium]
PPPPPEEAPLSEQSQPLPADTNTEVEVAAAPEMELDQPGSDSLQLAELQDKYSDFYLLTQGEEELIRVKTDELTVNISTKGGALHAAYLNHYYTYDSAILPIIAPHPGNKFLFQFAYKGGRSIQSTDLYFTPSQRELTLSGEDQKELVLTARVDDKRSIEQVYTFKGDAFDFHYEIRFNGFKSDLKNGFYELNWKAFLPKTELSLQNMRPKSTIVYNMGGDVERLGVSNDPITEDITTPVKWVSYKSQFFSGILVADEQFKSARLAMETPESEEINRVMESVLYVEAPRSDQISNGFMFYMGPNEYHTLRSYKLDLQKEMDLGWWIISYINIGTIYIFKFLESFISNYGIIIILLAVFIRLLLFPLSYKSHVSMAKMRVINNTPEMKALDQKYKDDPQKLQMEKMAIYRKMGVNMFGGCLPMLFSYPFLIALFFFFPQSVELRQQSFLWAHDLSTYDSILELPFRIPGYGDHVSLFCLLMAASTFVYTIYQQKSQPATGAGAQMKYIAYFMPLVLLIFLNSYAAGLSLYYFVSNIISISQTVIIRKFVDDEKLLAQMREAAKTKKSKKGGKSQSRLEKWVTNQQKKQQEALRERKQQQKGSNRQSRRRK